jgi:hypothetical protein
LFGSPPTSWFFPTVIFSFVQLYCLVGVYLLPAYIFGPQGVAGPEKEPSPPWELRLPSPYLRRLRSFHTVYSTLFFLSACCEYSRPSFVCVSLSSFFLLCCLAYFYKHYLIPIFSECSECPRSRFIHIFTLDILSLPMAFIFQQIDIDAYNFVVIVTQRRHRDSSVGISTGYGLDGQGWIPGIARFFSSPQRPDPLCLLSNGYRGLFPRDKATGA